MADLIIQPSLANFLDVDAVRVLEDGDLLARDGAEDADREAGAWEGVALNEIGRNGEEAAEGADFICGRRARVSGRLAGKRKGRTHL